MFTEYYNILFQLIQVHYFNYINTNNKTHWYQNYLIEIVIKFL